MIDLRSGKLIAAVENDLMFGHEIERVREAGTGSPVTVSEIAQFVTEWYLELFAIDGWLAVAPTFRREIA